MNIVLLLNAIRLRALEIDVGYNALWVWLAMHSVRSERKHSAYIFPIEFQKKCWKGWPFPSWSTRSIILKTNNFSFSEHLKWKESNLTLYSHEKCSMTPPAWVWVHIKEKSRYVIKLSCSLEAYRRGEVETLSLMQRLKSHKSARETSSVCCEL